MDSEGRHQLGFDSGANEHNSHGWTTSPLHNHSLALNTYPPLPSSLPLYATPSLPCYFFSMRLASIAMPKGYFILNNKGSRSILATDGS